jgi:hypothetical protein
VQVDPVKPKLKPPGSERSKLEYDTLPSKFAFNFNLRRYKKEAFAAQLTHADEQFGSGPRANTPLSVEQRERDVPCAPRHRDLAPALREPLQDDHDTE